MHADTPACMYADIHCMCILRISVKYGVVHYISMEISESTYADACSPSQTKLYHWPVIRRRAASTPSVWNPQICLSWMWSCLCSCFEHPQIPVHCYSRAHFRRMLNSVSWASSFGTICSKTKHIPLDHNTQSFKSQNLEGTVAGLRAAHWIHIHIHTHVHIHIHIHIHIHEC